MGRKRRAGMWFAPRPGLRLGQPPSPLLRHRTPSPVGTLHHLTIPLSPGASKRQCATHCKMLAPKWRSPSATQSATEATPSPAAAPATLLADRILLGCLWPIRDGTGQPSIPCSVGSPPLRRPFPPGQSAPREGSPVRVQICILLVAPAGPGETAEPSVSGGTRTPARRWRGGRSGSKNRM